MKMLITFLKRINLKAFGLIGMLVLIVGIIVVQGLGSENVENSFTSEELDFKMLRNGLTQININGFNSNMGFAVTGKIGEQDYIATTENFDWTWSKEEYNAIRRRVNITRLNEKEAIEPVEDITEDLIDNLTLVVTNLTATNNDNELNLIQQWIFDPEKNPKIKYQVTNNLGNDITNVIFWFVFKLPEGFRIKHGGNSYDVSILQDTRIQNDLNLITPIIDLGEVEFRYSDLLQEDFIITDFYIGNGSIIGHPETLIGAIGVTKGNSILANGQTIILDPEVTAYKSPTRTGSFYFQWSNSDNIRVSDNAYASVTSSTTNPRISSDLYGLEEAITAGSTINGIEIQVEGKIGSVNCVE